jgi:hypothetical protein
MVCHYGARPSELYIGERRLPMRVCVQSNEYTTQSKYNNEL